MARRKDVSWSVPEQGDYISHEQATLAVLMDIRDEMKELKQIFRCHNAQDIPNILRGIRRNTHRPKRRKKKI